MGVLGAGLVIARRISLITTSSPAVLLSRNKKYEMFGDLAIGLAPPIAQIIECMYPASALLSLLFIILCHVVWFVSGHRFDILEDIGCYSAVPFSILDICLRWIWMFIIGILSAFYCCMFPFIIITIFVSILIYRL